MQVRKQLQVYGMVLLSPDNALTKDLQVGKQLQEYGMALPSPDSALTKGHVGLEAVTSLWNGCQS